MTVQHGVRDANNALQTEQSSLVEFISAQQISVVVEISTYWRYRRFLIAETAEIAKDKMKEDKPNEAAVFQQLVVRKSFSPSIGSLMGAFINRSPEDLARCFWCFIF